MARPEKKISDCDRERVKIMAAMGLQQEKIAEVMQMAPKTLRKHFQVELSSGADTINQTVVAKLYEQCINGNTAALIFWCKTRLKWSDKPELENDNSVMQGLSIHVIPKSDHDYPDA